MSCRALAWNCWKEMFFWTLSRGFNTLLFSRPFSFFFLFFLSLPSSLPPLPPVSLSFSLLPSLPFFLKSFIYLFLDRGGRETEREGEKHQHVRETQISCMCPNQGPAHNSGLCPNRESNQRPFALWADGQLAEPYCSGLIVL